MAEAGLERPSAMLAVGHLGAGAWGAWGGLNVPAEGSGEPGATGSGQLLFTNQEGCISLFHGLIQLHQCVPPPEYQSYILSHCSNEGHLYRKKGKKILTKLVILRYNS